MAVQAENRDADKAVEARQDDTFAGFFDLSMTLRVELGRRKLRCGEVVALRVGTIVPLPRSAGDNVALLLNGRRIGAGEIVVIEDQMGLRITEIAGRSQGENR